jgi:hypothetical protein
MAKPLPAPGCSPCAKISYVLDTGIMATFENDLYQMLDPAKHDLTLIRPKPRFRTLTVE